MNTLSWLLYAADASNGLKALLAIVAVLVGIASCIVGYLWIDARSEGEDLSLKPVIGTISFALALAILAYLIPSRETVHMIAASELAERAVTSQDGREMIELLKKRVRSALEQKGER